MKKSITILTFMSVTLFAVSVVCVSCSSKKVEQTEETSQEATMPMDTTQTAYACPMHPDVTGKEGDKCSKCGMKLEAVASADTTKHEH